jgi:quinol monooxygenase YgiN
MTHTSAPFALVVRFTVSTGAETAFDDLVTETTAAIREREPGTLVYACHQVDGAPQMRIFYELYRDRSAFDAHEEQPHVKRFLAAREALLDAIEVDFMTLADGKTPACDGAADRG